MGKQISFEVGPERLWREPAIDLWHSAWVILFALWVVTAPSLDRSLALGSAEDQAVVMLNRYRVLAGLAPVTLDPELSASCQEHTRYLALHFGSKAVEGLGAHDQKASLPGASERGALCGKRGDIYRGTGSLVDAVHAWMNTLYHRTPILKPGLTRVGLAATPQPDGTQAAALMFADESEVEHEPVLYPVPDQVEVPIAFLGEVPDPTRGDSSAGYPVTVQFPTKAKVRDVRLRLEDAVGASVAAYVSHPASPAIRFPQGPVACLIPKDPLQPATRYQVSLTARVDGVAREFRWSFETQKVPAVAVSDLEAHVGELVQVHGRLTSGYLDRQRPILLTTDVRSAKQLLIAPQPALLQRAWKERDVREAGGRPFEVRGVLIKTGTATFQLETRFYDHLQIGSPDPPKRIESTDTKALDAVEGGKITLVGRVSGAGRFPSGKSVYLELPGRGTLLADVDSGVWKTLAGKRAPELYVGLPIEVTGVPERALLTTRIHVFSRDQLQLPKLDDPGQVVDGRDFDLGRLQALAASGRLVRTRGVVYQAEESDGNTYYFLARDTRDPTLVAVVPSVIVKSRKVPSGPDILGRELEVLALPRNDGNQISLPVVAVDRVSVVDTYPPPRIDVGSSELAQRKGRRTVVFGAVKRGGWTGDQRFAYLLLVDRSPKDRVLLFIEASDWAGLSSKRPEELAGQNVEAEVIPRASRDGLSLDPVKPFKMQLGDQPPPKKPKR